jgi:NADPH2:quinone reductase
VSRIDPATNTVVATVPVGQHPSNPAIAPDGLAGRARTAPSRRGQSAVRSRLVKAIRIHEDGGPEVLRYEDAPDPEPGADEVLIRLAAASLNHLDVWVRKGLPSVPKPRILGADGAGVVEALGPDASRLEPGQRVVINPGVISNGRMHVVGEAMDGTHAELAAIPARNVYPIPDELSFEEAAAFPLVFETAYRMLVTRARLQESETVFVWGIGGGVATAALAIAKTHGARVIVTSSSEEKLARARELGADETIDHASEDVRARVKELTKGQGADIVIETVGDATWKTSLEVAAQRGRIVVCGATTGPNPPAGLHRMWWKELDVYGSTMGSAGDFEACLDLVTSGAVRPVIDEVLPLADARAAHERLESGAQLGKIVLRIPE